jgi:hypothetical protein
MRGPVMAAIATYPGLRDVRLRELARGEEGAPAVYMIFDLYFDSLADMDAALASATRQAVRATIQEGMRGLQGRVDHLVFSEGEAAAAP